MLSQNHLHWRLPGGVWEFKEAIWLEGALRKSEAEGEFDEDVKVGRDGEKTVVPISA